MENEKKTFEVLIKKLNEIRSLMGQHTITCEFSGERILIISEGSGPEYLGPEFEIGSVDILTESHRDPKIKNIMDKLAVAELLNVYKSFP